jgi:hypothetical protein
MLIFVRVLLRLVNVGGSVSRECTAAVFRVTLWFRVMLN